MSLLVNIALFSVGLVAIIKGADWLTDGAASIAKRFGIPTIVVGLTIVAIGSSAPEFVVSVLSAIKGNADIALGNIVGSNIFNILGIMGITALVCPIKVTKANVRHDLPFAVLSSVAVAAPVLFANSCGEVGISRADGILMLCIFSIFITYTIAIATGKQHRAPADTAGAIEASTADTAETSIASDSRREEISVWKAVAGVVIGLACLLIGGEWLVDGASGIATAMGISQSIIALTIVSIGTSAPELAASAMAAKKGDTAMALGNIVGSVVFNVFFVLGTAATIRPISAGGITTFDILSLLAASVLLWVFCTFGKTYRTLTRTEGIIFVILMAAYYTCLILNPQP